MPPTYQFELGCKEHKLSLHGTPLLTPLGSCWELGLSAMYCPEGGNTCSNEWYYVDISFDEDINEEFK